MNDFLDLPQISDSTNAPDNFSDSSGAFFDGVLSKPAVVGEKYVVFYLNEKPFGVAARRVAEVSRPLAVASVPHAPEWLAGIANLRGEIITIIDLPKMLAEEPLTISAKTKFVVLQSDGANSAFAFYADRLGEIVFVTTDEIDSDGEEDSPFIRGQALYNYDVLQIVNAEKLLVSLTVN